MIETFSLQNGVTLRCFPDSRFTQSCLSVQFVRMARDGEAAMNALIPAVLLRGTVSAPDMRSITLRLDELYGASVSAMVRRVGDYQTTGLYASFISDRFTMDGERLLEPVVDFLRQLLLEPVTENGRFRDDFVESEKKNMISAIEAQINDKRGYAVSRLLKIMSGDDPMGVSRMGEASEAAAIDSEALYRHYRRVVKESPVEIFYVGQAAPEAVAAVLRPLFDGIDRDYRAIPPQTPFRGASPGDRVETMQIAQGKLALGFVTPITFSDPRLFSMQVMMNLLGGGMTSKLFVNIREKLSLCYDISAGYRGSKGVAVVFAGIDPDTGELVREKILQQLGDCQAGAFTARELEAAKSSLISGLCATHDSPGVIESYYATGALSGLTLTPEAYMEKIAAVTSSDVTAAAQTVTLHTSYLLRGVD